MRTLVSMAAGGALVVIVLLAARAYAQEGATPTSISGGAVVEQATAPQNTIVDATTAVVRTFTYQGVLLNSQNAPVPNGTYAMVLTLYRDNTTAIWQETQNATVIDGFFSVRLGSVVALPLDEFVDRQMWLGVRVGADAEMTPRQPLTQVPYAFVSERLNQFRSYGVVNADGSRRNGFRFDSSLNQGGNFYLIDIKETYNNSDYVTLVTPISSGDGCVGSVSPVINGSNGQLLVELFGANGSRVRCPFQFQVLDIP
ncbi:MAG: hypothetical protein ACRC1H_07130 [Caldilineaceae bacterium]